MTSYSIPDSQLNPATRLLWRGEKCIQLELGDRSVVVEGIPAATVRALLARTTAPPPQSSAEATSAAPPAQRPAPRPNRDLIAPIRRALSDGGFLWPRCTTEDSRLVPPVPRLAGELAALTALHGERGAEILNARRYATVAVHGCGQVGTHIAAVLAAAGVGRTYLHDIREARLHQTQPGGLSPHDEGSPAAAAAAAAIHRAAPEADTRALSVDERPDLIVLAIDEPVDPDRRDSLHARGAAHLLVQLGPMRGVVGPLVLPGLTSCLRCADLHRLDRDPAWTALAVQLATPRRYRDGAPVALATTLAGVAAMQALSYLDGGEPDVIDGTLELALPQWQLRRRSWPIHPDCDCVGIRRD